jgi:hypothetical protein
MVTKEAPGYSASPDRPGEFSDQEVTVSGAVSIVAGSWNPWRNW